MTHDLATLAVEGQQIFRVGHPPNVWTFTPWRYADNGVFTGRWDDPQGHFRVLYAGDSLRGCFMELLAPFRPDPAVADGLADIADEPGDVPTSTAGTLPHDWASQRRVGTAHLTGKFCVTTDSSSIAWLRQRLGRDLDAGVLRDPQQREVTQHAATALHANPELTGVRYYSRLGDDEGLWAVFERNTDPAAALTKCHTDDVDPTNPDLQEALELFHITLLPPD